MIEETSWGAKAVADKKYGERREDQRVVVVVHASEKKELSTETITRS